MRRGKQGRFIIPDQFAFPEYRGCGRFRRARQSKWRWILLVAAGLGVLCLGAPVSADISYETKIAIDGADDSELSDLLDDVSQLKKLEEDKKPASEEALRRRADDDLERLKDAAHSLGYWNAQ